VNELYTVQRLNQGRTVTPPCWMIGRGSPRAVLPAAIGGGFSASDRIGPLRDALEGPTRAFSFPLDNLNEEGRTDGTGADRRARTGPDRQRVNKG
jgi:hypothetical protein